MSCGISTTHHQSHYCCTAGADDFVYRLVQKTLLAVSEFFNSQYSAGYIHYLLVQACAHTVSQPRRAPRTLHLTPARHRPRACSATRLLQHQASWRLTQHYHAPISQWMQAWACSVIVCMTACLSINIHTHRARFDHPCQAAAHGLWHSLCPLHAGT